MCVCVCVCVCARMDEFVLGEGGGSKIANRGNKEGSIANCCAVCDPTTGISVCLSDRILSMRSSVWQWRSRAMES